MQLSTQGIGGKVGDSSAKLDVSVALADGQILHIDDLVVILDGGWFDAPNRVANHDARLVYSGIDGRLASKVATDIAGYADVACIRDGSLVVPTQPGRHFVVLRISIEVDFNRLSLDEAFPLQTGLNG